jgi:hypothetical protein
VQIEFKGDAGDLLTGKVVASVNRSLALGFN